MADHSADDSPTRAERPEPVLDEARIVAGVSGALPLLTGIAIAAGWVQTGQTDSISAGLVAVTGALVGLINATVAFWRARKARDRVTPLASPQTASGEPLIAETSLPAIADAKAAAQVPEPGEPVPTPWEEDSTFIGAVVVP